MTLPIPLPQHCCIFYDEASTELLPRRFITFLQHAHQATFLSKNTFLEKLNHCADHSGIIVTGSLVQLTAYFDALSIADLPMEKLHVLVLDPDFQSKNPSPSGTMHHHTIENLDQLKSLPLFKRKIKKLITLVERLLQRQIKAQKLTHKQEGLHFKQSFEACIRAHYADKTYKIAHVAQSLGISVSTLERKCQRHLGALPNELITRFRLTKAKALVENSLLGMSQIARQTGFASASYFTVKFNEAYGATPTQLRNKRDRMAS